MRLLMLPGPVRWEGFCAGRLLGPGDTRRARRLRGREPGRTRTWTSLNKKTGRLDLSSQRGSPAHYKGNTKGIATAGQSVALHHRAD
eukprot:gene13906-biopygen9127